MTRLLAFFTVTIALLLSTRAEALNFAHPQANVLVESIESSLRGARADGDLQIANIQGQVHSLYSNPGLLLDNELVLLKWLHAHWQMTIQNALLTKLETARNVPHLTALITELTQLELYTDAEAVQKIQTAMERVTAQGISETSKALLYHRVSHLLATYGEVFSSREILSKLAESLGSDLYLRIAGPGLMTLIPPMYHSKFGADLWMSDIRHGEYFFVDEQTVLYRGLRLQAGDILALDHNSYSDGVNTCFSQPRSCATHSFQFEILERPDPATGKISRFPVVFEVYERGFRVLPLETALSPVFTLWARVVRPIDAPIDRKTRAEAIEKFLSDKLAKYDFMALRPHTGGPSIVSCSTAVELICLYHHASETLARLERSEIPEGTQRLLKKMGLYFAQYLTPTDFLRAGLPSVGQINNMTTERFWKNLARELVMGSSAGAQGSFGNLITQRELDTSKLAWDFPVLRYLANYIYAERRLAHFLAWIVGPTFDHFPHAPPDALAYIIGTNKRFELLVRAVRDMLSPTQTRASLLGSVWMGGPFRGRKEIRALRDSCSEAIAALSERPFDLEDFESQSVIRSARDRAIKAISDTFR